MIRPLALAFIFTAGSLFSLNAQDSATVVPADDAAEVAKFIGKQATVEGKVVRVGTTKGGGITFLNFSSKPDGFVAVIFKPSYSGFPDGFEKFKGKTLRVSGEISIYRDSIAQIVVKEPAQVEVVEAAP